MNRKLLGLAVLGGWLTLPSAYAQFGGGPSELSMIKLNDDMYVISNVAVPGLVTALVTNEGVVLVDDKFEVDHDNILAMLKTVTNQPIKYVVNTHHHGDHSGDNVKMLALGAQVVASEQARQHMVDGKQAGLPVMTFNDRGFIHLGGQNVELYYFGRAHTSGDVFVYFPAQKALAAGDAFTYGDRQPQLIDYPGGGSAKDWTGTLDKALQLDFDTVVPGHGDVTTKEEMRKFRDSTFTMRTRVHEMILQKKSKDEIGNVLKTELHGAQMVFPGLIDGLLVELQ
jgi:glyoxylase-like metal-dependent hydrolase (beta-lactamase superfamily II)